MGLFSKKETTKVPTKEILVSTLCDIPGRKFETIGVITAHVPSLAGSEKHLDSVIAKLTEKAVKIDADAILGFNTFMVNVFAAIQVYGYGTAVKFVD